MPKSTTPPAAERTEAPETASHPNARPVVGPTGVVHPSATAARRVAGVGRGRFAEMLRDPASGWRYADEAGEGRA